MKSKSAITASISALIGQTLSFAQEALLKLQSTKYHDRSKGKDRIPSKNYVKGSYYSQKTGPFNKHKENSRRVKQIGLGMIKASQVQS